MLYLACRCIVFASEKNTVDINNEKIEIYYEDSNLEEKNKREIQEINDFKKEINLCYCKFFIKNHISEINKGIVEVL